MRDTVLFDVAGNSIHEGDKMSNTLANGNATYEVKFHKGDWWLFDGDIPYMMLIPKFNSNQISQYKVVQNKNARPLGSGVYF